MFWTSSLLVDHQHVQHVVVVLEVDLQVSDRLPRQLIEQLGMFVVVNVVDSRSGRERCSPPASPRPRRRRR